MKKLLHDAQRGNLGQTPLREAASADLMAFVAHYEAPSPRTSTNKVIDAQVSTFRHNREHYQKITANLLPILVDADLGRLGRASA